MKNLLTFLCSFFVFHALGQNYQCLQSGAIRYFHNDFIRAVAIDSVIVSGSKVVYYPYRSARGSYLPTAGVSQLDSNGGSWLGKTVIQYLDGTTLFDTYWGDTVFVHTRAGVGQSWLFYNDISDRYYTATVMAIDTLTINGSTDSVKSIIITAYNSAGVNTADIAHGRQIRIGKNNGFIETFSLYTFPFHPPGISSYQSGIDYLMDNRDVVNGVLYSYTLLQSPPIRYNDIYNDNVGDVFGYTTLAAMSGVTLKTWQVDSIIAKTSITGSVVNYTIDRATKTYHPPVQGSAYWTYNQTVVNRYADTSLLIGSGFIPEKTLNPYSVRIDYADTMFCITAPAVSIDNGLYSLLAFEPCYKIERFKVGLGRISYWECFDPAGSSVSEDLVFYKKNGKLCGNSFSATGLAEVNNDKLHVYPNPVNTVLFIKGVSCERFAIADMAGRVLLKGNIDASGSIDIRTLPAGHYLLYIKDDRQSITACQHIAVQH